MSYRKTARLCPYLLLSLWLLPGWGRAEIRLHAFDKGSYQHILQHNPHRPLLMLFWSVDCPPCLAELQMLAKHHDELAKMNLILISVDDRSVQEEVQSLLEQYKLSDVANWIFTSSPAALRFEIDPTWYGEVPRSYFYEAARPRQVISGQLSEKILRRMNSQP